MGSRAVLLALALVTVSNFAHASRTDSDGEPLQAPRIARVHRESQRFALGIGVRYDQLNLLTQTAAPEPFSFTELFSYDLAGNRLTATNRRGKTTTYECDPLNRLTGKTYPGGAPADVETYGYDENGNRTSLIDPKGQSFAYGYDALDRLTTETLPNPAPPTGDELTTRTTAYDPNGNVTRQEETYSTSGLAVETQTWDDFDRLLTKTDRHGETVSITYDANGNRKSVRDSDSVVTGYTYDDLNRLASQTGAGGVTTYDYFKNSLLKKTTYPNGASATQTYDLANRTQSITNRQNAAIVASYAYTYDDNGNRSEQLETNGGAPESTTYVYDDADRLTEVHYPDQTVTYTLDPVGNRETETIADAGGATTSAKTLAYDVRDRLLSVTDSVDPANNVTLAWDENGNQISKTQGSLLRGQIYDALDRLVEVQDNGLLLERYRYDPAGYRIRKAGPDGIFRYVRDDGAVLQQTDDAGATLARYEWGSDRLVSLTHTTEGRSFSLFDGLGSVVALSRPDGGIQTRYLWDAWGNLRSQVGGSENLFGFTGYERDDATGLFYAKARFYDSEIGRFLNEDPFAGVADTPPSLHRFLYAFGNPTVYWDPDGRESLKQVVQDYAADAYSDGNWFEKGIAFLGQAAYAVAEAASVGAVGRIDSAQEQLDRGEITKDQYWNQTGKAVVKSGAIIAVGAATGGAGALVARGAGAGATATAVISGTAAGLGSQAGGDLVEGELSSVQDYALSGGLGAAGGLAVRGVQALKASGVGDMTVGQATKSVVSKLKSAVLGESASTGGAAVAEVTVTQSASASSAADDIWDQLVRNAGDPGDAANAAIRRSLEGAKSGEILGPAGPGQFVLRSGQGSLESAGVLRTGGELNRVFDSRWQLGRPYSQPMGGSFSPSSSLPNSASQSIIDRGLNWPGVINNAELGVIYRAGQNLPVTLRTSLGGTAPEVLIAPPYRSGLQQVGGFVPISP